MEDIKSCSSPKRGDEHKIETRNVEVANCVTSIDTDSMVREPQVIQKVGDRGTDNYSVKDISNTIPANPMSDRGQLLIEPQVLTPLRTEEGRQLRKHGIDKFGNRALYPREDGCSNTITTLTKDNYLQEPNGMEYKGKHIKEGDGLYTANTQEFFRGGLDGVSRTLKAETHDAGTCVMQGTRYRIRKLTPIEVGRLMNVDDTDIQKMIDAGISKTGLYKLFGNSIVVNVLYHIFRKMFIETKCEDQQLSLFDFDD